MYRYTMNTYTLDEIKKHNTTDDCWIIIHNNVYDVTNFLKEHPGGSSIIISIAGQDATEYFEELHRPQILEEVGSPYIIGEIGEIMSKL